MAYSTKPGYNSKTNKMYYVKGQGYFSAQPNTYTNDQGQQVVQTGGVLRNDDGTLHAAYKFQPTGADTANGQGSNTGSNYEQVMQILAKWRAGMPISDAERVLLEEYWEAQQSLPTVDDLGGDHNEGIITKPGTPDKNTTKTFRTKQGVVSKNKDGNYNIRGKQGWYTAANFS